MGVLPAGTAPGSKQLGAGQPAARSNSDEEHVTAEVDDSGEEKAGT